MVPRLTEMISGSLDTDLRKAFRCREKRSPQGDSQVVQAETVRNDLLQHHQARVKGLVQILTVPRLMLRHLLQTEG